MATEETENLNKKNIDFFGIGSENLTISISNTELKIEDQKRTPSLICPHTDRKHYARVIFRHLLIEYVQ